MGKDDSPTAFLEILEVATGSVPFSAVAGVSSSAGGAVTAVGMFASAHSLYLS